MRKNQVRCRRCVLGIRYFLRAYPREARMLVPVRKNHVQNCFQFRHDGMHSIHRFPILENTFAFALINLTFDTARNSASFFVNFLLNTLIGTDCPAAY